MDFSRHFWGGPCTPEVEFLSSPPELEYRPPPNAVPVVAVSIYTYSVYIYILFISNSVWGHSGELISVKIQ